MRKEEIVVVLTNKGYVAIENDQIFDLWKNKSLKVIYEELHQRYPTFAIHLGSMNCINFKNAVEESNKYLKKQKDMIIIKKPNNDNNQNIMKHSTFNTETAATIAKVAAGFTTQKVLGVLHLTVQTGADVLQFGADKVAKGEASILTKLKLYNESYDDLIKIRQDITKGYQEAVKQAPNKLLETSKVIRNKLEDLYVSINSKSVNQ